MGEATTQYIDPDDVECVTGAFVGGWMVILVSGRAYGYFATEREANRAANGHGFVVAS